MNSVSKRLVESVRRAAVYNPEVEEKPACILWPDHDRQWEAIIPRLQGELPELLILGDYESGQRTGPAIWLRCAIAGHVDDIDQPDGRPPLLYLPGVSRQDLRAVESCAEHLRPLAELQYRGVIWSQLNAKDWTILAFLKSDQGGLGLDVAQDNDSKHAMQLALYRLLDEEIELLIGKRLDKDYFNTLLTGGDPVRDLLQWLDQGDAFRNSRGEDEWSAFVEVCKSQLAFNPQNDGALAGAAKLATHVGPWQAIWDRYCEAPHRYPNIPGQIRKCQPPLFDFFAVIETTGGWPQWNEDQEQSLRHDLSNLDSVPAHKARQQILDLEKQHGPRRQLVWAELGDSPLALALEYLAVLAETTSHSLTAGNANDVAAGYRSSGWQADHTLLRALAAVTKNHDLEAVTTGIRCLYLPWAEDAARYLQKVVDTDGYPGGSIATAIRSGHKKDECILFVDGLRFDIAKQLAVALTQHGCQVDENPRWAALPTVTATGKPAASPVRDSIRGEEANADFEPCVAATGQSLKGGYHFKKLLHEDGWQTLDRSASGDGQGRAWCEFGDIDHEGHDRGWKLARQIPILLDEIRDQVLALLAAGWKNVHVVTDHGWLLLPGGLPKIELSSALVDNKWGRCAAIKQGASTDEKLYPWFWNPNQHFALANGVSCFRKGEEYAHGGLSLQECLLLELTVTQSDGGTEAASSVEFTDIVWKGLRCTVAVDGDFADLSLDIRTQPGNSETSVVLSVKALKDNGTASVVVVNEELEGSDATLVLVSDSGELIVQVSTVIGGGNE